MQRRPISDLPTLHLRRDERLPLTPSPPRNPDIPIGSRWSSHAPTLPQRINVRNHPDGNNAEAVTHRPE